MHDKDIGLTGAAPTLSKSGKHFQYLVSELTPFIVSTGHESVRLRCDGEPSTLALLQAACKACRSLGIKVTPEPTAIGNHQTNGGAERAVELIRSHVHMLLWRWQADFRLQSSCAFMGPSSCSVGVVAQSFSCFFWPGCIRTCNW